MDQGDARLPAAGAKAIDETALSMERTRLSHERTMMAWVRTGTSLITFGFTIYKFFQIDVRAERHVGLLTPRWFALMMISTGLVALLLATIQHHLEIRRLRAAGGRVPRSLAFAIGALVSVLGLLGLLAVVFRQ
jgi:putative membrane protein